MAQSSDQTAGHPGFGVYVHWPFCAAKCPYCDFNSHVRHEGYDAKRMLRAYRRELSHMAQLSPGETVTSIFFGGGTPSLMDPATVAGVLEAIADNWTVAGNVEITLEANPSSVEAAHFAGYRSAGVNRVSLGIQALNDNDLRALGRLHDVAQAQSALDIALKTFERVSFDLIYARPGQTTDAWLRELTQALTMQAGHISLYQLTIEPGTPFAARHAAGRLHIPDSEQASAFYEITQDLCEGAGLPAYEISNHAATGHQSRHNLTYWRYGTFAGVGPGAHGRLVVNGQRTSLSCERMPERWMARTEANGNGIVETLALSHAEQADEMLLMGLRISEGLSLQRLRHLTGFEPNAAILETLADDRLIEPVGPDERLRATPSGRILLDAVVLQLSAGLEPYEPAA